MKVTILEIHPVGPETEVVFACALGRARARWHGPTAVVSQSRFVELAVAQRLEWGRDIVLVAGPPAIEPARGGVRIYGHISLLEPPDDDGRDAVVVVDVGGSLLQVDATGAAPPAAAVGTGVRLDVPRLALYDMNL